MSTFLQLQTTVQTWLRDLPADTVAEIPGLIKEAVREIQRAHNFRCMEASSTFTTVAATAALGSVQDFKEPRADPYLLGNDSSTKRMTWQPSLDFVNDRYQADSEGQPRYVYWSSVNGTNLSSFIVYPLPDGLSDYVGGEYRVVLPYWKYLAELVDTTDTNWFTVNADKYIRLHALGSATLLNIDEGRGAAYMKMAQAEAVELIKRDKKERVVRPNVLRYSTGSGRLSTRSGWWAN